MCPGWSQIFHALTRRSSSRKQPFTPTRGLLWDPISQFDNRAFHYSRNYITIGLTAFAVQLSQTSDIIDAKRVRYGTSEQRCRNDSKNGARTPGPRHGSDRAGTPHPATLRRRDRK